MSVEVHIDLRDNSLLNDAVVAGNLELVQYYHQRGWDIHNDAGYAPEYPLWTSACDGHFDIVKYLVEQGADVHAHYNAAICYAAMNNHVDIVKYLAEHGADIHAHDNNCIYWAMFNGNIDLVKYLHGRGANVDFADNASLLVHACENDNFEMVKYFYENGDEVDRTIYRAVEEVIRKGSFNLLRYFLKNDPDLFNPMNSDFVMFAYEGRANLDMFTFILSFYLPVPLQARNSEIRDIVQHETLVAATMKFLQYYKDVHIPEGIILEILSYSCPLAAAIFKKKSRFFDKFFIK